MKSTRLYSIQSLFVGAMLGWFLILPLLSAQTGSNPEPVEISPKISSYLTAVLQSEPSLSPSINEQFIQAFKSKNSQEILDKVSPIKTDKNASALVIFVQSQLLLLQQDEAAARKVLSDAWQNGVRDPRVAAALGQLCFSALPNRLTDVAEFLSPSGAALLYTPLHPMTFACATYASGNAATADEQAKNAAGSDKTLLAFYHGKCAEIELLNKNPMLATDQFEKAVSIAPEPLEAWLMNLATLQLKWKNFTRARTCVEIILKRNPKNSMALDKLSMACFYLKDYGAARDTLLRLKELKALPEEKIAERLRQVEAKLATP